MDSDDWIVDKGNAKLIVTAANACHAINPDNPQAVAEAIPLLWELAWEAAKYDPIGFPKLSGMATEAIRKARG